MRRALLSAFGALAVTLFLLCPPAAAAPAWRLDRDEAASTSALMRSNVLALVAGQAPAAAGLRRLVVQPDHLFEHIRQAPLLGQPAAGDGVIEPQDVSFLLKEVFAPSGRLNRPVVALRHGLIQHKLAQVVKKPAGECFLRVRASGDPFGEHGCAARHGAAGLQRQP